MNQTNQQSNLFTNQQTKYAILFIKINDFLVVFLEVEIVHQVYLVINNNSKVLLERVIIICLEIQVYIISPILIFIYFDLGFWSSGNQSGVHLSNIRKISDLNFIEFNKWNQYSLCQCKYKLLWKQSSSSWNTKNEISSNNKDYW